MRKFFYTLAALAALSMPAQAGILSDALVSGVLNHFEDQSRESVFDMNGNATLDVGDVFIGFLRLDDRTAPPGFAGFSEPNGVYAVFSTEIKSQLGATFQLGPTTGAKATALGLTLDAITGPGALPAGTAMGMVAVYEGIDINLLSFAPSALKDGVAGLTIFDFIREVSDAPNILDLVVGPDNVAGGDFWQATVIHPAFGPGGLALLGSIPLGSTTLAIFDAGLTIEYNGLGADIDFEDAVPSPLLIPPTLHELTVTSGTVSGASNWTFSGVNPLFGSILDTTTANPDDVINYYGMADNADVEVIPTIIPEPSSVILWSLGGLGLMYVARRRKLAKVA